ncbi:MAG: DUF3298 domain-containing protein [Lachnospiraceae bacterium]|nr:DUF3298 domain-containing protein [Lachnospiraceae bacterium]
MKRLIAAAVITAIMAGSLLGCGAGQAKEPASQDMAQSEAVQEQAEPSQEQTEAAPEETAQAQPAAGQEETAQAKEAESDVVRPVYKLQSHSRMEEKDLTLIASGSYDTVRLTEEAAMNNVYLNKAIEIENDLIAERYEKSFAEVKEAAENAIAEQREDTEEFPVGNMEGKIIPVRCDQTVLSFYEVSSVYYPGAAHGSIGYSGYNYNPENGAQITLAEVFTDPAALKPVVAKYLRAQADGSPVEDAEDALQFYFDEGNMDALTWVIDQDGVTFLFAPSDIAPYAMGTLEARIYFDREPSLFTGNYGSSKEGYVKPLSPYTEMTVDLDGDGSDEKLSVTGTYEEGNEIYAYSGIQVCVGDQVCTTELYCFSMQPSFVHTEDGRNYVYVVTGTDNDYPELSVFAIKDNVPSFVGKMDGTGFASAFYPAYVDGEYSLEQSVNERYPMIDPSKFALGTRMQLMSTYSGRRFYKVGEDGMPAPLTDLYEIDADITLTTLVPVKAEVVDLSKEEATGEEKEIPAGTKLNFWRTNGTDTVDMRTDDMEVGEAFRFKVETSDGQIVNGIKLDEAFDGTMFGG